VTLAAVFIRADRGQLALLGWTRLENYDCAESGKEKAVPNAGRQFWEDRKDGSLRQIDRALRVDAASESAIRAEARYRQKVAAQLDKEGLLMSLACRNQET